MITISRSRSLIIALILCLCPGLYAADIIDKIVAVVNDDVITQSELQESMLPFVADYKVRYGEEELSDKLDEVRADALNRLIEEKLIIQEAKKRDIKVDDQEIEARLDAVKSRFKSPEEFEHILQSSGVTLAKLKDKYREQIMMRNFVSGLVNSNVRVTPTQVAAYYNAHREEFSTPPTVRFKVLMLKPMTGRDIKETEELAFKILARIQSGEDFDALVKKYSQGPNIDMGGDMGDMPADGIIKDIARSIARMNPGDISEVIKLSTGFNIIKLVDRKDAKELSMVEVTDEIRERLFQREAELSLREFIEKLKEDAYIEIQ